MCGNSLLDSILPVIPTQKKSLPQAKKKHSKESRKNISFDISVVDQSVDPPVNDSPLLTFNIPVIDLFYDKRSKRKFAKS